MSDRLSASTALPEPKHITKHGDGGKNGPQKKLPNKGSPQRIRIWHMG